MSWSWTKSRLQRWLSQGWHGDRRPRSDCAPSALPSPDRQALLAVEPLRLLAVQRQTISAKQDVQPTVAEPPALAGQLAQAGPQVGIVGPA